MQLVLENGDNWKIIAEQLGLRNKREAILEFVKLSLTEVD